MHCPETVENAKVGLGVGLGVGLLSVGCSVGDGVTTPSHCLFEMPAIRNVRNHFAQLCILFCSSVNTTSAGLFSALEMRPSCSCEGGGDVVGVVTPLVGGVAQAFHDDRVVELRVQLGVQEVEGKDREEQVEVERERRVKEVRPWMTWR